MEQAGTSLMLYEEYLAACRAELARQCRWTIQQANAALGNVIGCQERGMTVEEAVQHAMLDLFND